MHDAQVLCHGIPPPRPPLHLHLRFPVYPRWPAVQMPESCRRVKEVISEKPYLRDEGWHVRLEVGNPHLIVLPLRTQHGRKIGHYDGELYLTFLRTSLTTMIGRYDLD
jgi:hypothetical protein